MVAERQRPHPAYNPLAQASPPGIRPDAEATASLPTLTPGVSRLPTACTHCGSCFLNVEPPLGEHQRGMVTCAQCSRQICWLAAPMRTAAFQPYQAPIPPRVPAVRDAVVSPMVRPIISARFERGPGCGRACSISYGHDAREHEIYGGLQVLREQNERPFGICRTGPLVIDCDARTVALAGAPVPLTATEWKILAVLAARLGVVCTYEEIFAAVWDHMIPDLGRDNMHMLRIHVMRVRAKLGQARRLIETRKATGFMLRDVPPAPTERKGSI